MLFFIFSILDINLYCTIQSVHGDAVQCSTGAQLSRLGPGSAPSSRLATVNGFSLDDRSNREKSVANTNGDALNSKYESVNIEAGSISDPKTLKVRIRMGPGDLSTGENDAIYSGLGLDVSPSPSPDDSPSGSEGNFHGPLDDPFESPTSIIKVNYLPAIRFSIFFVLSLMRYFFEWWLGTDYDNPP